MTRLARTLLRLTCLLAVVAPGTARAADGPPPTGFRLAGLRQPPPRVPPDVAATFDVRYGEAANSANLLDVYRPKDAAGPLPCVVWIHGGAWFAGDKRVCRALPLVEHGFVVVSINYRLTSSAPYPAQIQDCKGAVRFLRAHAAEYGIDPNRIGAWGESAGGHLAALLGTSGGAAAVEGTVGGNASQSSRVQCVVDWFGPTDLTRFTDQATAAHHPVNRFDAFVMRAFVGGTPEEHLDVIQLANPIRFLPVVGPAAAVATATAAVALPPFLIMHGTNDRTVPIGQSQLLADALKAAGGSATFRIIDGLGHGFPMSRSDVGPVTMAFFEQQLKPAATTTRP